MPRDEIPPTLLSRKEVEKPWGRDSLPPPFAASPGRRIGEIWFEHPSGPLDLLVKYLFTSEKLSIQVHPDDEFARGQGLQSSKDECWLVLEAEPGAQLGIGTKRALSPEELREASLNGSIEQMLDWKPVKRGDFFYIPAGTVHAIGAGVTLVEIQQNADITYRLYDYGRPRELHLEQGVEVALAEPHAAEFASELDLSIDRHLVRGPKFDLWLGSGWPEAGLSQEPAHLIPIVGSVDVGGARASAGECLVCSAGAVLDVDDDTRILIAQARK